MKYMLIMRATDEANAAWEESGASFDDVMESMGRFNDEMVQSGVLVAAEGLDCRPQSPSATRWPRRSTTPTGNASCSCTTSCSAWRPIRLGRHDEGRADLGVALERCTSDQERLVLERKAAQSAT